MTSEEIPSLRYVGSKKHSVTLDWSPDPGGPTGATDPKIVYKVQLKDHTGEWVTKYWGYKTTKEITGLGPEEIYTFRVGSTKHIDEEYIWSKEITTATKDDFSKLFYLFKGIDRNNLPAIKSVLNERWRAVDCYDRLGETPLLRSVKLGRKECAALLLSSGAEVDGRAEHSGRTPLMYACYHGRLDIAVLLVEKGARWDLTDRNKCTALHFTVDNSQLELAKYAIKCGANIDAKDIHGWTPVIRAVMLNASESIVEELANSGANLDAKDEKGSTCFDLATLTRNICLLNFFKKYKRSKDIS